MTVEKKLKTIRQNGHRLTRQRKLVLDAITRNPQSVNEIHQTLVDQGETVDKVTIYRTLEYFIKLEFISKTQFNENSSLYELRDNSTHHHHLVCNNCGAIADITLDDQDLIQKITSKTSFKVTSHAWEFFGLCRKCQ